jgi:hypothetical protein
MSENNRIKQAGEYTLDKVELISYRRHQGEQTPHKVNIKPITLNVELTEDIYSNTMVGAITVYDMQDIRTVLPITGMEKLNLVFSTPGIEGVNATEEDGYPFQIYKIDEVRQDSANATGRGQFYKIFFCSSEMYFSSINRISKAYSGPIEDAVEDIFRDKTKLNSKKQFYFEPTSTNAKYVIPNLRPLNAINFLSSYAKSANYKNAGYLFFETPDGYHFRSVESLLGMGGAKARPAKFSFQSGISNIREGEVRDVMIDMSNVISYDFLRPADALRQIRTGVYANTLIEHDAFNKTFTKTEYDYLADFGKYFHTEHDNGDKAADKGMIPFTKFEDTNKDISQNYMAKLMTKTKATKLHNDYELPSHADTTQIRIPQYEGMKSTNLKLQVFGNSLLKAGDIITFDIPLMRPLGNTKDKRQESSPYFSGRYMITAIKHIINMKAQRYEMVLDCMKDAVRTSYPAELDQNIVNTPDRGVTSIYQADKDILSGDILEGVN